jgi:hypothetical protein
MVSLRLREAGMAYRNGLMVENKCDLPHLQIRIIAIADHAGLCVY